jgi:methylenetetrahydrofolate reductase (NADPH)
LQSETLLGFTMVKIIDKIMTAPKTQPFFSFEFFPPKTEAGVENLYLRMDRMTSLQPVFVDITWGAGGSTKDLTMAISEYTHTYFGVDVLMHLTCTNMRIEELKIILLAAREAGIENILALRGDPPKGAVSWEPVSGGCANSIELVKLIRKEHGDYFGIAVAGFPEGHPQSRENTDSDLIFLKEKVDAGADFILTQFFYDPEVFLGFVSRCNAIGINCPILPGTEN